MPSKVTIRWLSAFFVVLMYIAALWPFELIPPCLNPTVQWLSKGSPKESGVRITRCGALSTPGPPVKLGGRFRHSSGISVEVDLITETNDQGGPARIVTYSFNPRFRNFTLGQQKDALVFRLRTTATDLNGADPVLEVPSVFKPGTRQHLVVTYDGHEENLYVDGERVFTSRKLTGDFSNWDPEYYFLLGNELNGNRLWRGKLFGVSLYDHALSEDDIQKRYSALRRDLPAASLETKPETGLAARYRFSEGTGARVPDRSPSRIVGDLTIARFQSPMKEIFLKDFTAVFGWKDMLLNIIAFIPLSFLVVLNMPGPRRPVWLKIYLAPVLIGFAVSFSFEFLQQFTYSRNPNILDIVYNGGGSALGSIWIHIREKFGKDRLSNASLSGSPARFRE